ncbi:MAG: 4-hydroxy-tetrahydrodipicolinate synthase [Deltaproteobacteria bacterium]|nr:4-hydroxy-tetrahydrodipicolinate synthase [Deltaproteobacteria bacterium]
MILKGVFTAIVTPFKDNKIDEDSLKRLISFQIENGVDGLVPCGTTGEAPTLTYEEHERVIELTVKFVEKKVPVIAGTGSNSTHEAIELTEAAKKLGADMCLLTTPYYNKPTQEGLYRHFKRVAEEVDIPIILYNIPGRTGVNMSPETVARLAEIPNIVGIKEASGSVVQAAEIYRLTEGKFAILSGDDNLFLPLMSVGATGVISVASNAIPKMMKELFEAFMIEKNVEKAVRINTYLLPFFQAIFVETNPIPIKEILYFMGLTERELRLPLCSPSEKTSKYLEEISKKYGLYRR